MHSAPRHERAGSLRRRAHADAEPADRTHRSFQRGAQTGADDQFRRHRHDRDRDITRPGRDRPIRRRAAERCTGNQRAIHREVKDRGPSGHVLTGPIFVNGAQPGDTLEVRILEIDLAVDYGYNRQRPYAGALPDEFPGVFQRIIPIDRKAKAAQVAPGVVVPVDRPFFGVMGVAPTPAMGRISTSPLGVHTGNIDNKDLVAGTTLFMPVYAVGALFSVGDAHAAQGQGEVDLSAIETGNRGKFQFILRKDLKLTWPRGETPTHWMVMGLNPNLEEAMKIAVRETILFLTERFPRLSREEAYMIASVAVDYHVTQVVDGTKGIHGMIPKSIFIGQ